MSPDDMPVLGPMPGTGGRVHLNCGHGPLGWTMSSGCGHLVAAALLSGSGSREEAVLAPFSSARFAVGASEDFAGFRG